GLLDSLTSDGFGERFAFLQPAADAGQFNDRAVFNVMQRACCQQEAALLGDEQAGTTCHPGIDEVGQGCVTVCERTGVDHCLSSLPKCPTVSLICRWGTHTVTPVAERASPVRGVRFHVAGTRVGLVIEMIRWPSREYA